MFDKKNIIEDSNNQIFDKIKFFLIYLILVILGIGLLTYLFYESLRNSEMMGMLLILIYMMILGSLGSYASWYVRKDVEKFINKGVNTGNTPKGWASIVLRYPLLGFCWYLAIRKVVYSKQAKNILSENITIINSISETKIK